MISELVLISQFQLLMSNLMISTITKFIKSTIISTNSLIPIWPYEYSIVGDDSITAKRINDGSF